jgi:hypothetical protein
VVRVSALLAAASLGFGGLRLRALAAGLPGDRHFLVAEACGAGFTSAMGQFFGVLTVAELSGLFESAIGTSHFG